MLETWSFSASTRRSPSVTVIRRPRCAAAASTLLDDANAIRCMLRQQAQRPHDARGRERGQWHCSRQDGATRGRKSNSDDASPRTSSWSATQLPTRTQERQGHHVRGERGCSFSPAPGDRFRARHRSPPSSSLRVIRLFRHRTRHGESACDTFWEEPCVRRGLRRRPMAQALRLNAVESKLARPASPVTSSLSLRPMRRRPAGRPCRRPKGSSCARVGSTNAFHSAVAVKPVLLHGLRSHASAAKIAAKVPVFDGRGRRA